MQNSQSPKTPNPVAAPAANPMVRKPQFGARAVGSFVPRLTRAAFEKFGFSTASLITDWAHIVGADLARVTKPDRLKWPKGPLGRATAGHGDEVDTGRPGATLILRVDDGRALDIQYKTATIIERINSYFGYRAVAEIRILQAPIARAEARNAAPPPVPESPPPPVVASIKDDALRASLARMAAGLKARAAATKARRG